MFWPPKWISNNDCIVSDDRWLIDHPGDARFDQFMQSACVLSPWLSWADIDSKWDPNDPMMRILLIGEPSAELRSANQHEVGSIISLGALGQGVQRWEVVSFFDWYDGEDEEKKGAYAWCRLWNGVDGGGGEGGGGGGGEGSVLASDSWDAEDDETGHGSFNVETDDGLLVVGIAIQGGAIVTSMTVDGVAMTIADSTVSSLGGDTLNIAMYYAPIAASDAGLVEFVLMGASEAVGSWHILGGVTAINLADHDQDSAGTPTVTTAGTTSETNEIAIAFFGLKGANGGPVFTAPADFTDATYAAAADPDFDGRGCAAIIPDVAVTVTASLDSFGATVWAGIVATFKP